MIKRSVSEEEVKKNLRRLRGTDDIHEEFVRGLRQCIQGQNNNNKLAIFQRKYVPQMVMTFLIPFFQQLTGINVIMFYAPVLFQTLGFGNDASLMSSVITGLVNVAATLVAIFVVDWYGRRPLFLEGGFQMLLSQVSIGSLIWKVFGLAGVAIVSKGYAYGIVALICVYVAGFAWSWGPLG
ncbi:LOW QUALITY PROTEIN: hypothetical protein Sjap_003683 [Stephania japonica]|uniref:Uncharacterized protein n=1 Tax=Stephania japonica TaxID=461633 RepID=A0AAP0PTU1_9MAGN